MRRRPGIGGLQIAAAAAAARDQYRLLGENVAKISKEQLEDFARNHKNDIRKNPAFRSQFHEMCAKVGVDPLASNKGLWAELLGIGDFYYELAELESSDERSKTGFGLQEEENNSQSQTVPGTLLIPCRTAMRARFPLIETYFQDHEVFADYASMVRPINVPRNWMWNLQRWIVYFGTVSSILRDVVVMLGVALMLLGIQWVVAIMDQW